ncbi:sensor histidine kinase [Hazenella coriacea]|uniref:histidine kinase n=1 Tax=Hazenella coriacea TaxID=1179467 RepID=A0A4R3LBD1_9BACL|nr:sensor histidine kinase [Hazenella coriacea]TCS94826.1 signal transduction histidine kinase [Hazenella coriacea]
MKKISLLKRLRTRVSFQLGLLLISVFTLVLFSIGNIIYSLFLNFYLSHITTELLKQSHNHAFVLSDHFTTTTIDHVILMEKDAKNMVVVLDHQGNILGTSKEVTPVHQNYLTTAQQKGNEEQTLETNWDKEPFLVVSSPILQKDQRLGTVMMFSPTEPIREAVLILRWMLLVTGIITLLLVAGILGIISRMIVRPLIEMKQMTEEIAQGNYSRNLPVKGQDEVAQLARSINHMSREIQYYQQQRNEFLADISHELRTPLTYLKGYSEILLHPMKSESERHQYAQIIFEQTNRLQRLVQDLFDLARIERGDFSLHLEKIQLVDVMTQTLSLVEISMEDKEIQLNFYLSNSEESIYIKGDQERLGQVFLNILENARKYTPRGGKISVYIKRQNGHAVVEIADTGPGIPQADLPRLTERLYRVEKSRSLKTGGTGLGLTIVKEIVTLHQGTFQIHSIEGEGSVFTIQFPILDS